MAPDLAFDAGRVYNEDRESLHSVVPLAQPFAILIETTNFCNFKCRFCAAHAHCENQHTTFKRSNMSWELYKKIIEDLTEFEHPIKLLRPASFGEPLIQKDLPRMIAYAKERKVCDRFGIITNGSLLKPELSDQLLEAGLDELKISVEAVDAEGYWDMCRYKINIDQFVSNIKYFYEHRGNCKLWIKIVDKSVPTEEKKKKFYDMFGGICDQIGIENIVPAWPNYEQYCDDFDPENKCAYKKPRHFCETPFYKLVISPQGKAIVCCADWQYQIMIGDVNTTSVKNIWNGEPRMTFLKKIILNGYKAAHPLCAQCSEPEYFGLDNMDNYVEEVKKNFGM